MARERERGEINKRTISLLFIMFTLIRMHIGNKNDNNLPCARQSYKDLALNI